jgi:hypothetical protein
VRGHGGTGGSSLRHDFDGRTRTRFLSDLRAGGDETT